MGRVVDSQRSQFPFAPPQTDPRGSDTAARSKDEMSIYLSDEDVRKLLPMDVWGTLPRRLPAVATGAAGR